jgi:hypothetical protein
MRKETDDHLIGEPELEVGGLDPRRQQFRIDVTRSSVEEVSKPPGTAPYFRARLFTRLLQKIAFHTSDSPILRFPG